MIEYMLKGDPRILFLKPGENVYFTPAWPISRLAGKYFQVVKNKVVPRQVWKLVAQGGTEDIDLTKDNGWLPLSDDVLYEINLTMKGDVLLYPMWPSSDYLLQLEDPDFKPNPASSTNRYIGCYDESDIPFDGSNGILKLYTVRGMNHIRLRLYNDGIEDEKAVLKFIVNMCVLKPIARPSVYRKIQHYKELNTT